MRKIKKDWLSHGGLINLTPGVSKRAKKLTPRETLTNMEDKSMI